MYVDGYIHISLIWFVCIFCMYIFRCIDVYLNLCMYHVLQSWCFTLALISTYMYIDEDIHVSHIHVSHIYDLYIFKHIYVSCVKELTAYTSIDKYIWLCTLMKIYMFLIWMICMYIFRYGIYLNIYMYHALQNWQLTLALIRTYDGVHRFMHGLYTSFIRIYTL
jgi:hypothetical protein